MRIDKKKALTLFALTLLFTSLLLINMNGPTSAQQPDLIYLHGPSLTPIHKNSNKTLTPVHMHHEEGILQTLPECTWWHALYPEEYYCKRYHLLHWRDNGDGSFSPNDQINMTEEISGNWTMYHVDRITYTLNLSDPLLPENRIFIEFKGPPDRFFDVIQNPICTFWHEVWPGYSAVYHITSTTGPLEYCTLITLEEYVNRMPTGILTTWHVDEVATDIILREKIGDPTCTWWHAIYPPEEYCKWQHVTDWEDHELGQEYGAGLLTPGDQINMTEKESGNWTVYHVDRLTVTLNVTWFTEPSEWMKIEFKKYWWEDYMHPEEYLPIYEVFKNPNGSLWHEVYPNYCNVYNLTRWHWWEDDNCNGVLDVCDYIWLYNMTSEHEIEPELWHIEDITYDLILNKKISDPVCTYWQELYPDSSLENWVHVDDPWEDSQPEGELGHGLLSPCDYVNLTRQPQPGPSGIFHVENVTLTINVTNEYGYPFIFEYNGTFEDMYLPKTKPVGTWWDMIWPDFHMEHLQIDAWEDNCNGVLDRCDNISLGFVWVHVEDVAVDMTVKSEEPPPPPSWYKKAAYPDYAPSGMPDFDQKQDAWYPVFPVPQPGHWTWCGPTAVADSLWWFDSRYDPSNIVPVFPGVPHDHHVRNVAPLVANLSWWMDTDGQRTGVAHTGTWWQDMEWGIKQYLQQQGITTLEVHNRTFPEFYWIEEEIYRCQDVVLLLEFWWWSPTGGWERVIQPYDLPGGEGGHYVTCAGVNSSTFELLICDPWWDAAEAGWPGDLPVPHAPHGDPTVHNDTQYVSHDAYTVTQWMGPQPGPYGAQPIEELVNYLQQYNPQLYDPNYHTFITAAVVTSPLAENDVAVIDVTTSKDGCDPMPNVGEGEPVEVNATVKNVGDYTEIFNVTAYADAFVIGELQATLNPGENVTLTFTWDTTGFAYGNYTISAVADTVPGETNTGDNTGTADEDIKVGIPGDINADGTVNILDAIRLAGAFGSEPGDTNWNPNADINGDGVVNILDAIKLAGHFGESEP